MQQASGFPRWLVDGAHYLGCCWCCRVQTSELTLQRIRLTRCGGGATRTMTARKGVRRKGETQDETGPGWWELVAR